MNILYITNYDTMYGANFCLYELAVSLKTKYNVVPYVLAPRGGQLEAMLQTYGIKCLHQGFRIYAIDECTKYKKFRKLTRRIMRYVDYYRILYDIRKQKLKFDLVHTNTSITDLGDFLSKKMRIPHVWHIREFAREDYGLECVLSDRAVEKRYMRTGKIIAISKAVQYAVEKIGQNMPIVQIYDGIVIREPYHKEYISGGCIKYCIVGSISPGKNQMDAVIACHKLLLQGYDQFKLYIVGDIGGEYYDKLRTYIEKNGLADYIKFTGYIEDINAFLENMDVGIMASYKEAFGRVTIEYMANYMMVIGTESGATPEIIQNAGLLYKVHDTDELAEHMISCMKEQLMLVNKGVMARKIAEQFTNNNNADAIYNVYQELLD